MVSRLNHGLIVLILMGSVAGLLAWKSSRIAIVYADGLRYIRQARLIDQGSLADGLLRAVDHPVYPVAITLAHRVIGGDRPDDWQSAAQFVSVLSGILLVIPLYLVASEIFGGRVAWLSVLLCFLSPVVVNVLSDALSEGLFLVFWTWGLWTSLRFLREGRFGWLPATLSMAVAAYMTRPEGLLLPTAMALSLLSMPLLRSGNLNWPRWWAAVGAMVIGPALLLSPFLVYKGGLGTKPAIARILGTAPRSGAEAVERNRPLDEDEPATRTYAVAAKAAFEAVRDAATIPGLVLGLLGLVISRVWTQRPRQTLFAAIILSACALALIRLHATGGYCSPRHALVPALLILSASGLGLNSLLNALSIPGRWLGEADGRIRLGPIFWVLALAGVALWNREGLTAPVNQPFTAYKLAAHWLEDVRSPDEKVVDLTGWTQFYSGSDGYTFANVIYAGADQKARWVVAREAHVHGPWIYCRLIRNLIGHATPVAAFPEHPEPGQARVLVFDRRIEDQAMLMGTPEETRIR